MRNFNLLTISVILCSWWQSSFAQQVYQASHYGSPGDYYLYNRLNSGFSNDDMIQSGENVTWDLSTLTQLNTHVNEIVEPEDAFNPFAFLQICPLSGLSSGECFTIWNNTDQALLLQDTLTLLQFTLVKVQRFQQKTADQLLENFFGFTTYVQGSPNEVVIVYQNPDTIIQFPVEYDNQWTSHSSLTFDLSPSGQNIMFTSNQSRITEIDGWGTIMTPEDTFENVVRLRSEILRHDTITMDSSIFPITLNLVEYMWLDTNYALPVMTAQGTVLPGDSTVLDVIEYIYEATCPAPTWTVDIGSDEFYIDESGSVTVNFNINQSNANEYTWDFGDGSFAVTDGNVSHVYSEPGEYTIAVNGCMTNCLPLNSCSFQIIDFEVIDTISSITTIAGAELGIKLYPNPSNDQINVFIPDQLRFSNYQVLDLTGRPISSGKVASGLSSLNIQEIPGGLYFLQLQGEEKSAQPVAYMRFSVMRL